MGTRRPRSTAGKVPVSVTIDVALLEQLDALIGQAGLSRSDLVAQLIEDYIEDVELARLAGSEMEEILAGRAQTVSLDEVKRELGL
jgi:predicted DNA-binding protein